MKLAGRLTLVAFAIPVIFFVHFCGIFFVRALLSRYEAAFEWPIIGAAILSFIVVTTLVIVVIFRVQSK